MLHIPWLASDVTSKVGTKAAALKAQPEKFLKNFGRQVPPSTDSLDLAEQFLVRVLKSGTKCKTFDQIRVEMMTQGKKSNLLNIPCTSASLRGHLNRSFYMVYTCASVLNTGPSLNSIEYGWVISDEDSSPMPDPCLKELPYEVMITCGCKNCNTRRCQCRKHSLACASFCKCHSICENTKETDEDM